MLKTIRQKTWIATIVALEGLRDSRCFIIELTIQPIMKLGTSHPSSPLLT